MFTFLGVLDLFSNFPHPALCPGERPLGTVSNEFPCPLTFSWVEPMERTNWRSARSVRWRYLFPWLLRFLTKLIGAPFLSWRLPLLCASNHSLPLYLQAKWWQWFLTVASLGVLYSALLVSLKCAHTFADSPFIKLASILPLENTTYFLRWHWVITQLFLYSYL